MFQTNNGRATAANLHTQKNLAAVHSNYRTRSRREVGANGQAAVKIWQAWFRVCTHIQVAGQQDLPTLIMA